ncbi:MAG: hypothetical protein KDC10_11715 [Calditrichaeota bacterium]|nr:hypothetical protein [Candidatus Cloacimonadota bacterium]MCB1047854.1 hypothetical protein [Calditrichota bacterium]MCB9473765.1 hypothetical protein [Candidatus Delongbacteria bacterium]
MRNLMLGFVLGGCMIAGTALATGNDIFEVSLGGRYMLDSGYYSDTFEFNPTTSVFPLMGANQVGFGAGVAMGHWFQSKRGGYGVLVKYNFNTAPEGDGTFYTDATGNYLDVSAPSAGNLINDVVGTLQQHDLMLIFRLSSDLFPYDWMRNPNLFVDLGAGVTTLSYDYTLTQSVSGSPATPTVATTRTITRSGMAWSAGLGYNFKLYDDVNLAVRGDMSFGRIQDIQNVQGDVVRTSPNTNNFQLSLVLTKYFNSLF